MTFRFKTNDEQIILYPEFASGRYLIKYDRKVISKVVKESQNDKIWGLLTNDDLYYFVHRNTAYFYDGADFLAEPLATIMSVESIERALFSSDRKTIHCKVEAIVPG